MLQKASKALSLKADMQSSAPGLRGGCLGAPIIDFPAKGVRKDSGREVCY